VAPFDGGRIVAILSPKVWLLGAPILIGIFILIPSPMFLLVLILLAPSIWTAVRSAWKGTVPETNPRYYEVPQQARVRYASYYLLLLAYLCVMTFRVHDELREIAPAP
jgi:hypothetical protein